ncbi:MAG: GroES family chaperonin [Acidimicrobiia bacterium]
MDLPSAAGLSADSLDGRPRRSSEDRAGDARQSIRMTADRILVLGSQEVGERRSRAGIVIPATANVDRRLVWGEVVALGPAVRSVDPGDRVLFAPDSGHEVEIRGDEYLILRERDIHAVAAKRSEGQTGLYL